MPHDAAMQVVRNNLAAQLGNQDILNALRSVDNMEGSWNDVYDQTPSPLPGGRAQ